MIGAAKEIDHSDIRVRLYAGFECFPHQHRCTLDSGSMADIAYHYPDYHPQHHYLPYLETQT